MAFFRGEEGSVSFDNGTGTVGAIASTTAWTLDTTKDTLETTSHGATSRSFVGSLISGSGTVDLLYTATSGDDTAEIISDVLTTEDAGDATFNLFLDTSGTKKFLLIRLSYLETEFFTVIFSSFYVYVDNLSFYYLFFLF